MQEFLFEIVEELSKISINDVISNGKRMSSAIVIICCLHKMAVTKCLSCLQRSKLFSLLYMMPDITQKTCEDWDFLENFIPKSFRETVCAALNRFIFYQIKDLRNPFSFPIWLFAIPIVHFLNRASKPFQELQLDPRRIKWEDSFVDLTIVKEKTYEYGTQ